MANVKTAFYTNYSDLKFIDKLKRSIDTCKSFSFSVSFIKKQGLLLLAPNMEAALSRGASGRLITSTYQNFTDIDSLTFFYDLSNRYPNSKKMHIFVRKTANEDGIQLPFIYIGSGKMEYIPGSRKENGAHLFRVAMNATAPEDLYFDFRLPGYDGRQG